MITTRKIKRSELTEIAGMGNQTHACLFLNNIDLETQERESSKNDTVYLSTLSSSELLAGDIIFCFNDQPKNIPLKHYIAIVSG